MLPGVWQSNEKSRNLPEVLREQMLMKVAWGRFLRHQPIGLPRPKAAAPDPDEGFAQKTRSRSETSPFDAVSGHSCVSTKPSVS